MMTRRNEAAGAVTALIVKELNPSQQRAALDSGKEVQAIACAGSGKSRTLAYRIARLIAEGVDPSEIVAFTFTEKAADSMKRTAAEVFQKCGMDATVLGRMYIGTIHGYCNRILRVVDARYGQFDVLDPNRLALYLMDRYGLLGLNSLRSSRSERYFETIRQVRDAWQTLNEECINPVDVVDADPLVGDVLVNLGRMLDEDEFIDFSLMVRKIAEGLELEDEGTLRATSNVKHLMVDEYQDVNPVQETLIRHLHARGETLFVVGDDDQSIYAWRGADVSNCLTFTQRYPGATRHELSLNYRSTAAIVSMADRFAHAQLGASRLPKSPQAHRNMGPRQMQRVVFDDRADEAAWIARRIRRLLGTRFEERDGTVRGLTPADFAILMRSTRTANSDGTPRHHAFTQALSAAGIPYTLEAGGSAFDRPEVDVIREAFNLLRNDTPDRDVVTAFYQTRLLPRYPQANLGQFIQVMTKWGREIHAPIATGGRRRRVYPQKLLHDLLEAFHVAEADFSPDVMADIGIVSRILQDVESVFPSIDGTNRFATILNFMANMAENGYDTSTQEAVIRPDAVAVSTVHQVKGLEYPVVFIVDLENLRFPVTQRRYRGWLPEDVIQDALARNAYVTTREDEARLFYTAMTRAERFLYLTAATRLPGGARRSKPSDFFVGVSHEELVEDSTTEPDGLEPCPPERRSDESTLPTSFSDIRYYLSCPRDYQLRKRFGFSPPIEETFGYGRSAHACIGKLHEQFTTRAPTEDEARAIAAEMFHVKHAIPSRDPNRPGPYELMRDAAAKTVAEYARDHANDFLSTRQVEEPFEVPVQDAVISGEIDLLLHADETGKPREATVIDFKSGTGGNDPRRPIQAEWSELALQVQLYAKAANEVLGRIARDGAVHFLKDNDRIDVPVTDEAVAAAMENVGWAVKGIRENRFPMRPEENKCGQCDFRQLCGKVPEPLDGPEPPPIHIPVEKGGPTRKARCFTD